MYQLIILVAIVLCANFSLYGQNEQFVTDPFTRDQIGYSVIDNDVNQLPKLFLSLQLPEISLKTNLTTTAGLNFSYRLGSKLYFEAKGEYAFMEELFWIPDYQNSYHYEAGMSLRLFKTNNTKSTSFMARHKSSERHSIMFNFSNANYSSNVFLRGGVYQRSMNVATSAKDNYMISSINGLFSINHFSSVENSLGIYAGFMQMTNENFNVELDEYGKFSRRVVKRMFADIMHAPYNDYSVYERLGEKYRVNSSGGFVFNNLGWRAGADLAEIDLNKLFNYTVGIEFGKMPSTENYGGYIQGHFKVQLVK